MTAGQLKKLCMSLAGATETIQWECNRVFKIGGKMFAVSGTEKDSFYSFKAEDHRFLELTDLGGVNPAPYLARAKWVQIEPKACVIPDAELKELVRQSYAIILARLPKKTQKEIAEKG